MPEQTTKSLTEAEVVQVTNIIFEDLRALSNHEQTVSQQQFTEIGNTIAIVYSHWKDCSESTRHYICRVHVEYDVVAEKMKYTDLAETAAVVLELKELWFENHEWFYENFISNPFEADDDDDSISTTSSSDYSLDLDPYGLRATLEDDEEPNMMDELGLSIGLFDN
ncbi:hypothetical protein CDD81_419 [Ophiocordyceps australis]|uniref:Uncharacterized protein n=1 Tax=Ophiocordyceps australis TaxID=1399860 RepID=A0A2C5Y362_9HYPO|nr:hypothetical protein CDD81_419 [Ophiocordyceps australis]